MFTKLSITCEYELDGVNQTLTVEELAIVEVLPEDVLAPLFQDLEDAFGLGVAGGGKHASIIKLLQEHGFNARLIRKFGKWLLKQGVEDGWLLYELGYA